jgi:hypothetical protein
MNKLILAVAALATVAVTSGCKHVVVRHSHPVEVVETRDVHHDRTVVYGRREPVRVVREVHPAPRTVVVPVPVPSRPHEAKHHGRGPDYRVPPGHRDRRPLPPAHSQSRHHREYDGRRPVVTVHPQPKRHERDDNERRDAWARLRERSRDETSHQRREVHRDRPTIKRQPVVTVTPRLHPQPERHERDRREERHDRNRSTPATKRQPVVTITPRMQPQPKRPVQPVKQHRQWQQLRERQQQASQRREQAEQEVKREREEEEASSDHPSSRASVRAQERSAHNRRD